MTEDFSNNIEPRTEKSPKRFSSLNEFKRLEEFPDTKPLVIASQAGDIIYSNHAFTNLFMLAEQESLSALDSEPGLDSLIEGLLNSKYASLHFDLFLPSKDGSLPSFYFVEVERIYIGEFQFFVFIFTSLDDKNKIENKINNLLNALEYGNVPVIITDSLGRITYSTKSFEDILGREIEFLYNKTLGEVFSGMLTADDLEDFIQNIHDVKDCVKVISDLDMLGKLCYKEIRLTPVDRGTNEALHFIVTAHDITDYILKNRIIQRSEERQKSIINNISDLLLIVRKVNDSIVFENANDNFYGVFGLKREEARQKSIQEVFEEKFVSILLNAFDGLSNGTTHYREFRYRNIPASREYLGSVTFTDDRYEEGRIFIISLKDITEQLLNEERLRMAYEKETHLNKLKSAFLANMSHEIRTPLNAIVGYSELIEDDIRSGDGEATLELFPYLKEGFNRLLNLMDNILEVSLIQSGEIEFEISYTDVEPVLRGVYDNFLRSADIKSLQFSIDVQPGIRIKADKNKLAKILTMLVDNAIKYTEMGGSVQMSCYSENDFVQITISDTGQGIKEENLSRMLEPFSQEDEGHKRKYEGAGLGLTIAYNLTRLMGGEFKVDSITGYGTTITIIFPDSASENSF